jgi:hypothetical protein
MKKLIFALLFLSSCGYFIKSIDDSGQSVLKMDTKKLSIIFSHNINGETHPCGCRHHPLGGLPQVAGMMHEIQKSSKTFYIDTGDTLFDNVEVPKTLVRSQEYKAKTIVEALEKLDLQLFTPGDQDFANGANYLKKLQEEHKLPVFLSNLSNQTMFKYHKKYQVIENGPHKLFFMAVFDPVLLRNRSLAFNFENPMTAIPKAINELEKIGYSSSNKFHRLILMSHSGYDKDKAIAKKFPQIDWIVGAHSQSFFRKARKIGNTKIVQVLSRNHYLGEIKFDFTGDKTKDTYAIHEMRDNVKDKLKPNPFVAFIDQHKIKLKKIQSDEQDIMLAQYDKNKKVFPYETASSCMECHEKQSEFWQGTAHSLAYITLQKAKEENNLSCIKCHALGTNNPKGFSSVKNIIQFNPDFVKEHEVAKQRKAYWKKLNSSLSMTKSVRETSSSERVKIAKKWNKHDENFKLSHNFANVQCLNCHVKDDDHPFESVKSTLNSDQLYKSMKKACIGCHTSDQSPEWYEKNEKGLATKLNELVLVDKMKKVACPKK